MPHEQEGRPEASAEKDHEVECEAISVLDLERQILKRKWFQYRNESIFYGHFQYLSHRARGFDSMATAASNRRRELARSGLHQGAR